MPYCNTINSYVEMTLVRHSINFTVIYIDCMSTVRLTLQHEIDNIVVQLYTSTKKQTVPVPTHCYPVVHI